MSFRKRNRIIAKVKSKYWVKNHKFGIKVPKSVEQAVQFDKKTGTPYCGMQYAKK